MDEPEHAVGCGAAASGDDVAAEARGECAGSGLSAGSLHWAAMPCGDAARGEFLPALWNATKESGESGCLTSAVMIRV